MKPIININNSWNVYIIVLIVNIGGFTFGTIAAWSSPESAKFGTEDNPLDRILTEDEISWLGSLPGLGCVFGPYIYSFLMNKVGRKLTILVSAWPAIISQIILAFVPEINAYFAARFIGGISQAASYFLLPVYVAEISKPNNRGFLSTSVITAVLGGMLFSYCVGPYVSVETFNSILIVPGVLYFIGAILLVPESPLYYLNKNEDDKAEEILISLRGTKFVEDELEEMKKEIQPEEGSILEIFRTKAGKRAFFICLNVQLAMACTGIGPILAFTQTILESSGSTMDSAVSAIIEGIVQLFTCLALSGVVDKFGRRIMMLISTAGVILSEIVFGIYFYLKDNDVDVSNISWLPLVSLVTVLIMLSVGLGPLSSVIVGELFPLNVKAQGSGIVISISFLVNFLSTYFYNDLRNAIGIGPTFWLFAGLLIIFEVYFFFGLVETKEKSLQEIQDILNS